MKKYLFFLLAAMVCVPSYLHAENTIEEISPAGGSTLRGFQVNDVVTFKTSIDSYCKAFSFRLIDQEGNTELYHTFVSQKDDEGKWKFIFYSSIEFKKGHTYTVELKGHADVDQNSPQVGSTMYAIYYGDGDEYSYSTVTYKIAPGDGEEINDVQQNYCIINFLGGEGYIDQEKSKIIDEDGEDHNFIQLNDVNNEHTKWQLLISADLLRKCTSGLTLVVYAKDKDDLVIRGNKGLDENSHIEVTYQCYLGYPSVSIYPAEGKQNTIEQFTFTCEGGVTVMDNESTIILYKADKSAVIESIVASDIQPSEIDNQALIATLANALTQEGEYYLYIPECIFGLGERTIANRETWVRYEIVDRTKAYGVTLDPSPSNVVAKLSTINITFDDWDVAAPYGFLLSKTPITVTNVNGAVVTTATAGFDVNRSQKNLCYITLNQPIEMPGVYRLNIPDKAFVLDHTGNYNSTAMYFDYTVQQGDTPGTTVNAVISTELADDNSLSRIKLHFTEYTYVNVAAQNQTVSVFDSTGALAATGILKEDQAKTDLFVQINDAYKIRESGVYKLFIPTNSVQLAGKLNQTPLTFNVPFSMSGIRNITTGDSHADDIYDMQGRRVQHVSNKGVYVINGKKVVVK